MRRNYQRRQYNNFQRNNFQNRRRRIGIFRKRYLNYNQNNNLNQNTFYYYRKLFVYNLDFQTTGFELNKIFSKIGRLTRCFINYNKLGDSLGSANVDYADPRDARNAINQFDNTKIGRNFIRVTYKRNKGFNNNFGRFNNQNRNFGFNNFNQKRRLVIRRRRRY